ncbi:MAG: hypothetical protein ACRCUI_06985 [Polymorphobacter sp.]
MTTTDAILDAWVHVIVRDGWTQARIDAVARAADCSVAMVAAHAADRWDALRALEARLDRLVLAEAASDPDESVRNRLFALLMARFDAMQELRDFARTLHAAARTDPALAVFAMAQLPPMLRRLGEAAGVDAGGLRGPLRIAALVALYVQVGRVWLADDSADLGPTMKALDSALARAERAANFRPLRLVARFPGDFKDPPEAPGSTGDRPPE